MRAGWRCLLVIVGCWGCAGDLENPERFSFLLDGGTKVTAAQGATGTTGGTGGTSGIPKAPECLTSLFAASCSSAGCHAADAEPLDLVSSGVEDRLVNKPSSSTACKNYVYVTTDGSPSLLLQKLQAKPPCGLRMPLGPPLSADQLACVSGWVEAVSNAGGGR